MLLQPASLNQDQRAYDSETQADRVSDEGILCEVSVIYVDTVRGM